MEFKVYDAAFAKQNNKAPVNGMPLVSWDIYSQFLFQTNAGIFRVGKVDEIPIKAGEKPPYGTALPSAASHTFFALVFGNTNLSFGG